jgi:hypothetical protein
MTVPSLASASSPGVSIQPCAPQFFTPEQKQYGLLLAGVIFIQRMRTTIIQIVDSWTEAF